MNSFRFKVSMHLLVLQWRVRLICLLFFFLSTYAECKCYTLHSPPPKRKYFDEDPDGRFDKTNLKNKHI